MKVIVIILVYIMPFERDRSGFSIIIHILWAFLHKIVSL